MKVYRRSQLFVKALRWRHVHHFLHDFPFHLRIHSEIPENNRRNFIKENYLQLNQINDSNQFERELTCFPFDNFSKESDLIMSIKQICLFVSQQTKNGLLWDKSLFMNHKLLFQPSSSHKLLLIYFFPFGKLLSLENPNNTGLSLIHFHYYVVTVIQFHTLWN